MGKNLHHNHPGIFIHSNGPGCMWGVLHVLKYQQWRHYVKRLPHKKHGGGSKSGSRSGNPETSVNDIRDDAKPDEIKAGKQHNTVGENSAPSTSATNSSSGQSRIKGDEKSASSTTKGSSVKSRLKGLISNEIFKMRVRHQRSSTYPTQTQHLEPSDEETSAEIQLNDEHPVVIDDERSSTSISTDTSLEEVYDHQNHEDFLAFISDNQMRDNQVEGTDKQLIEPDGSLQENLENKAQKSDHENHLKTGASDHQSKEMLDALDLVNRNRDFILGILHNPGSPLVRNFLNQQAMSNRTRYSKTVSFPAPGPSRESGFETTKGKNEQEGFQSQGKVQEDSHKQNLAESRHKRYSRSMSTPTISAEYRADGIHNLNQADNHLKKHGQNQVVLKRFKDLKQKIKHSIKESKQERHRITMDAVLHKIPHRHGFSKDLNKETIDQMKDQLMDMEGNDSPRSSCESDHSLVSTIKSEMRYVSRASSFSESLDKYCQLYESSCNREVKNQNADTPRLRSEHEASTRKNASKSMRRFCSLPNIIYQEALRDDSSQVGTVADGRMDTKSDISVEKTGHHSKEPSDTFSINDDLQGFDANIQLDGKLIGTSDAFGNFTLDSEFEDKQDIFSATNNSIIELEETRPAAEPGSEVQEAATSLASFPIAEVHTEEESDPSQKVFLPSHSDSMEDDLVESNVDAAAVDEGKLEKTEESHKKMANEMLQVQVDAKDKAEFDYVKDILELSGFSGNEMLGTWHSDDQPVDRSVFEELEGCMFLDPECCTTEGVICYQLLLFDLINEVLMEIYAKSYTYYPKPLSPQSHIRPMPVGHHVLEEVWSDIRWYLSSSPESDQQSLDYAASRDLDKSDGWMNLQYEAECLGIELEDMIFDDLLDEIVGLEF